MADVVQAFALTANPGANTTVLSSLDCPLGISDVTQIDLVFPPGCAGLVGARVEFSHNPVYPIGPTSFFILDDDRLQIPVSKQGNSGQWTVSAYNLDQYAHIIRVYFYFNYVDYNAAASSGLVAL